MPACRGNVQKSMTAEALSSDRPEPVRVDGRADRDATGVGARAAPRFLPGLFAGYRDLSKLRFDYPLVLSRSADGAPILRPLSGVVDSLLQEIATRGQKGERVRQHVLALEETIRSMVFAGVRGSLSALWSSAESKLLSGAGDAKLDALRDSLARARAALPLDGELLDCDQNTAATLLAHLWSGVENDRARGSLNRIDRLISGLSDILKVDRMNSGEWRTAEKLRGSFGTSFHPAFDFEAMSRLLATARRREAIPVTRRHRIEAALAILKSQGFFAPADRLNDAGIRENLHVFVFDSCTRALEAFQARLPEMAALVKAVATAELELDNAYRESEHDAFFERFTPESLTPADLAMFPSYLVRVRREELEAAQRASLIDILSSGLPLKVLVQTGDLLESPPIHAGRLTFGRNGSQLAAMAVGLTGAYVVQSSSSHLYPMRDRILRGLKYDGPALFSVFSGSGAAMPGIPAYLVAASAMESRAFPAFSCDPSAGEGWASRVSVDDNPQLHLDWPIHRVDCEDEQLQRNAQDAAFTFIDFAGCDRRHAACLTAIPRTQWDENLIPAAAYMALEEGERAGKVSYVLMFDQFNTVHRLVVDDTLLAAARRCLDMWRSLRELGGIDGTRVHGLAGDAEDAREEGREVQARTREPEQKVAPVSVGEAKSSEAAVGEEVGEPVAAAAGEPYIETARCTTCEECIAINNRMFAYNENRQGYIADPDAGTYRELVEAAEKCQVCIIHPGKPRDPTEPNMDEWIERARPFN